MPRQPFICLCAAFFLHLLLCLAQQQDDDKDDFGGAPSVHPGQHGSKLGLRDSSALYPLQPLAPGQNESFQLQLWSEKYKYFACLVPKCGTTSWLELIFKTHLSEAEMGDKTSHGISFLHRRKSYDEYGLFFRHRGQKSTKPHEVGARNVLNDPSYFKFAIVRHPWTRIVSGFQNKYIENCGGKRTCFKNRFVSTIDANLSLPVTLTEFLLALLQQPIIEMNRHFRPSSHMCDVGRYPYDFIGDLANAEHMEYILKKIKSPVSLSHGNSASSHTKGDSSHLACSRQTVDLAARLYRSDLDAFGYSMDAAYDSCEKHGLAVPPQ